ncbi:MAG: ATP-binding cassette domain-containing protein, partial [Gammaproteobacteria bacterium]
SGAVERARERCGLADKGGRLIANLSKGYQQRVGIAQAIVHDPAVVILDEPTVGLDPNQIRAVRELIRDLGQDHGVILSTHILPEVQSVCTRVQIINQGRLVYSDSLAGLEQRARVPALYLRVRQAPSIAELEAIDAVERVEVAGDGGFTLYHPVDVDIQDAVARTVLERGWGLLSLYPRTEGLERVFVDLTVGDVDQSVAVTGDATVAAEVGR